ncbi:MAG: carbohydrate-binding protein [Acidobacteriota bacterium]
MKKVLVFGLAVLVLQAITPSLQATTCYLSPLGFDGSPGTAAQPWATFGRAWQSIRPGDTLILLDGVYKTALQPPFGGQPGAPITIRALNDGKAVIDGEHVRTPIFLANYRNAHYMTIEGLIAINGTVSPAPQQVVYIETDHNILRRVSAYNADADENTAVIGLGATADYNLIEDCVAAGTGRKMINVYKGQYNTVRRCVAYWLGWDGKASCQNWPQVTNIHVYNGSNNIVENSIALGRIAYTSITVHANAPGVVAVNNQVLGCIAINGGVNPDGSVIEWPLSRPQPTTCDPNQVYDYANWSGLRVGFSLYSHTQAEVSNTLFRDDLASNNAGLGLSSMISAVSAGNRLERVTLSGNGLGLVSDGGPGTDALYSELQKLAITDSKIAVVRDSQGRSYPAYTGQGARLRHRYIDGVLMDGSNGQPAQALWPWPMEQRIRDELGISITNTIAQVIPGQVSPVAESTKPALQLSTMYTSFGIVAGAGASRPITLKNLSGSQGFRVQAYRLEKGPASPFSTSQGTCPAAPFVLGPSQSCTIQVALKPGSDAAYSDRLYFDSPDAPAYPFPPRVYLSAFYRQVPASTALPALLQAEGYKSSNGGFQLKATTDSNGSLKISGIQSGAWLEYPISIPNAGNYTITARTSSSSSAARSFSLLLDGNPIASFSPPLTGGWETFTDSVVSGVSLPAGSHTLRVNLTAGSFDLNYLHFSLGGNTVSPPSPPKNLSVIDVK